MIGSTAQGQAIGTGYKNTEAIVTQSGGGTTVNKAGTIARAYRGPNSLSDWYLPSKDELNELFLKKDTVGGFSTGLYWSSSEYAATYAWDQDFLYGSQGVTSKSKTTSVRPVRAFG